MNKQNEMYDVNKYTDDELYNILDLINPSDRELEAKIIFLMRKYENMQNKSGDELANFFKKIYNHFFETSDDEYEDDLIEGMDNENNDYVGKDDANLQVINGNIMLNADMDKGNIEKTLIEQEKIRGNYNQPTGNTMNIISEQLSDISRNMGYILDNNSQYRKDGVGFTKPIDYAQDKLNPLLQQTVKRIISIDSQYRDDKTTLSTEFTFNLSEPLKDVVSLKLYSIQIPYTWYTINNNFGSNFFYIKGNSPGIDDGNFDFQIDISAGNYSPVNLINEISNNIQKVITNNPDINFGNTGISYNPNNSLSTINLDIKNIYNETNYYLEFGNWTNPNYDVNNYDTGNIQLRETSIPSFLGFNYTTYYPNVLYSNYLPSTGITKYDDTSSLNYQIFTKNSMNGNIIGNIKNNYFTIIKYRGDITYNKDISGNIVSDYNLNNIDTSYNIELSFSDGTYVTRNQIVEDLSNIIANQSYLIGSYIKRNDISSNITPSKAGNGNSQFELSLKLNRKQTNNNENSKILVQFPIESGNKTSVWTGTTSCFNFPSLTNELNNVYSETAPLKQTGNLIPIQTNPYIYLSSGEKGYDVSSNDYIIPIVNSPIGYTINGFIDAINNGIQNVKDIYSNVKYSDFNSTTSKAYIDANSKFNLQLDINKKFTNNHYYLEASGILKNIIGLSGDYLNGNLDLTTSKNTFSSQFNIKGAYSIGIDNSCLLIIRPSKQNYGNQNAGEFRVYLDASSNSYVIKDNAYNYYNFTDLQNHINSSFKTYSDNGSNILYGTYITLNVDGNKIDASFNISINKVLTQKYYRIQFCDISANPNLSNNINGNLLISSGNLNSNGNLISTNGNLVNYNDGCWSKLNIDQNYCGLNSSYYDLSNIPLTNSYTALTSLNSITIQRITLTQDNSNNIIRFKPYSSGVKTYNGQNDIIISIPTKDISNNVIQYSRDNLINEINHQLSNNPLTNGSYIQIINNANNIESTKIRININKIYTTSDYRLVFYDQESFVKCSSGVNSVRNATWDTTLGWILGFRNSTIYNMSEYTPINNLISLTGDTTVSVNLFNYFLICLDDYNQNHLNDGLVTLTPKITEIPLPSYANRTNYICDPVTGTLTYNTNTVNNITNSKLTQNQIYALTEIANSKRSSSIISNSTNITAKGYGSGPFVKDVFGIIPMKTAGLANGSVYVEFGGTLQNQERSYFGPVNIHRMSIKLVSDRGDVLDLNGSNWSFSLICEQLYQKKPTSGLQNK